MWTYLQGNTNKTNKQTKELEIPWKKASLRAQKRDPSLVIDWGGGECFAEEQK